MDKRVILAVAGSGKTYHICHKINPKKRNLILAFTNENIYNIQKELCNAYGRVPELTTVSTFDSFVYHHLVLPYEPSIAQHFGNLGFSSRGISMIKSPPMRIQGKSGYKITNPYYIKKDRLEHYITKQDQYYCDTLSELVLQVKQKRESLVKRAAQRLNLFFDCVLIDEFQDFREYDYELIMKIAKELNEVVLVGDYYQHSVSADNNSGKPFKKKSKDVSFDEFVDELINCGFNVDLTTLDKSRRCSEDICQYVRQKLGINIHSSGKNQGTVIWADEYAEQILDNQQIVKLVYKDSIRYSFPAVNWSYSKGDTMQAVCVILTDKFDQLASESFSIKGIPISTLNKLYVAMTRSCGDLYLIKSSTFKKIKNNYIKIN